MRNYFLYVVVAYFPLILSLSKDDLCFLDKNLLKLNKRQSEFVAI